MNEETYKSLKDLTAYLELARANGLLTPVLEAELSLVNLWVEETAEDYVTRCHLCGAVEENHYCTNETCAEYEGK